VVPSGSQCSKNLTSPAHYYLFLLGQLQSSRDKHLDVVALCFRYEFDLFQNWPLSRFLKSDDRYYHIWPHSPLLSRLVLVRHSQKTWAAHVLAHRTSKQKRPVQWGLYRPTMYEDVQRLFQDDMVVSIEEFFDRFDPSPIGIASLAQVHVAKHKLSGKYVAVKVRGVLCCCLGQCLSFSFL